MDKLLQGVDFNALINSANNQLYCGEECQKKKKENTLREKVNKAALAIKNAPLDYEKAQEKYIKFLHGEAYYTDYKDNLDKTSFIKEIRQPINHIKATLSQIDEVGRNNKYLNKTISILEENIQNEYDKITNIERVLDNTQLELDTTKQKNVYDNNNTSFLKNIHYYISVIYYCLLIVLVIVVYRRRGLSLWFIGLIIFVIFITWIIDYHLT